MHENIILSFGKIRKTLNEARINQMRLILKQLKKSIESANIFYQLTTIVYKIDTMSEDIKVMKRELYSFMGMAYNEYMNQNSDDEEINT